MRRDVGLPPLLLARILRLQSAIRRIRMKADTDLGQTAVAAGYFDQAHFCREFRRFSDLSPSEFLVRERGLTEVFLESAPV